MTHDGVEARFPDAEYLVLSSRLIPDLDGGYTLATLARARQMAEAGVHGGRGPLLLTVDPGSAADHTQHRAAFLERGRIADSGVMRNLFDEAAAPSGGAAQWLRDASHPGEPDPALEYRAVTDAASRPVVDLPVIVGDPDWHTTTAPIVVRGDDGEVVGAVDGFGALYRAWLEHVVDGVRARDSDLPVVVVCESRQLGELLVDWNDPGVRVLHAIHTIHLEPPYTPDAPMNALWSRWFGVADRFDAVLWPTHAQRADVVARFGPSDTHVVVPHGVAPAASGPDRPVRVPGRVVMLNRLAPGKRIDHAIRAFRDVAERVPQARLDIFGDGPERTRLDALVRELGMGGWVTVHGPSDRVADELATASVFLSTSAYEGQGLAIVEALADGCPVVSYAAPYGPRELLADGGGVLVADADESALADALVCVLTDADLHARLSREAVVAAAAVDPDHAMAALAEVANAALARPSRRC
ncbi:glycosyltransferase [Microbacterium koreense]|uniref:Glycosyltransferase n=1 Tax=Microbacterium koreense TaxID=323761 RepID=A0ABW2ZUG9_9MICO